MFITYPWLGTAALQDYEKKIWIVKSTVELVYIQVSSSWLVEQFEDQISFRWSWKKERKHLDETICLKKFSK